MVCKLTGVFTLEYRQTLANLFELAGFNVEYNKLTDEFLISADEVYSENSQMQANILASLEAFCFFE